MVDSWIKLRTKLPKDGRLKAAARECHAESVTGRVTKVTLMLGALVTLWCLADEHADQDGVLFGYTQDDVDAEVGVPGFCESLPAEWIDLSGQYVKLPEYQEHNGTTGKSRAQATKRKRRERGVTDVPNASRSERDSGVTREEKRREEPSVGEFSASVLDLEGASASGARAPGEPVTPGTASNAEAQAAVRSCVALRKLGMRVQPAMPQLLDLVARGTTVEQLCMTAAELALRKASMFGDPDLHPELLELFASGATQQQMLLTTPQYTALRNAAPNIGYLAQTLIGRAQDAARGDGYGQSIGRSQAGGASGQGSAAGRAEAARRAGDARDAAGNDDNGF